MMMQLKCLDYVYCEIMLCNDIRLVMKYLCVLLYCDDVKVLISHVRVVFKGCSHAITIELKTMTIEGLVFYDLN